MDHNCIVRTKSGAVIGKQAKGAVSRNCGTPEMVGIIKPKEGGKDEQRSQIRARI